MTNPVRILGVAGSLRSASYNAALLRAAQQLAPPDAPITIYDDLGKLPLYDQDLDAKDDNAIVTRARKLVAEHDALLIVTPEYNYNVPGVLKNWLDWVSRPPATTPLKNKPAAIMGASTGISGTMRAQLALRQSFVFTQTYPLQGPEVVVAKCAERFDAELRLTDEATKKVVQQLVERLRDYARVLRREA